MNFLIIILVAIASLAPHPPFTEPISFTGKINVFEKDERKSPMNHKTTVERAKAATSRIHSYLK